MFPVLREDGRNSAVHPIGAVNLGNVGQCSPSHSKPANSSLQLRRLLRRLATSQSRFLGILTLKFGKQFSATWSDRNLSGEALERRVNDVNVFESGRCAVSSRAWCSFFNVMRLGPIVSAKGCCSATFFASKEVPTLVSHGNSLRSIQLNWAFGGLLQYAQEMNWEQKIDSIKKQLNSHSEWCNSCRIRNEVWQSQSRCTSHHAMLHDAPWCTMMHLASLASSLFRAASSSFSGVSHGTADHSLKAAWFSGFLGGERLIQSCTHAKRVCRRPSKS